MGLIWGFSVLFCLIGERFSFKEVKPSGMFGYKSVTVRHGILGDRLIEVTRYKQIRIGNPRPKEEELRLGKSLANELMCLDGFFVKVAVTKSALVVCQVGLIPAVIYQTQGRRPFPACCPEKVLSILLSTVFKLKLAEHIQVVRRTVCHIDEAHVSFQAMLLVSRSHF